MKIRTGFVSNSSSSSYIVAVAQVTDGHKVREWIKREGIEIGKEARLVHLQSIYEDDVHLTYSGEPVLIKDDKIVVESFQTDAAIPIGNMLSTDELLIVCIENNEGDNDFRGIDDYPDYDIDLDHFSGDQRKLYDGIEKYNGFGAIDKKFGAGRNGRTFLLNSQHAADQINLWRCLNYIVLS